MKNSCYLFLIFFAFTTWQCKKTNETPAETGALEVTFIAKYGNSPLVLNQNYDYNGMPLRFQRLGFYINYMLNDATGNMVWVDFQDNIDTTSAKKGITKIRLDKQAPGIYNNAINFNIGVNPTFNAKLPTDFKPDNPLSMSENYWEGWNSYIFTKMDGRVDAYHTGVFDSAFSYHTGSNAAYRNIGVASWTIKANQTAHITIEIDYQKVLKNIDVIAEPNTHTLAKINLINKIMDNYKDDIIIK